MPRELDEKDIAILKKLAPECGDLTCSGSGHMFHSILPPVSNHFAEDSNDFIARISRLSNEELTYITDMIKKGELGLKSGKGAYDYAGVDPAEASRLEDRHGVVW